MIFDFEDGKEDNVWIKKLVGRNGSFVRRESLDRKFWNLVSGSVETCEFANTVRTC